jgi:hypothetical protein
VPGRTFEAASPFSREELEAIGDPGPFLLRARIIENLEGVFGHLRDRLSRHLKQGSYLAPDGVDWTRGKIGRGEYLDGVPYVYLDLPRYLQEENAFTFRALFWWGHRVSFSLILGGPHLPQYRRRLLENLEVLGALQVHISTAANPWDWHRGSGHTLRLSAGGDRSLLQLFKEQSYLKCCRYLEFDDPEFRENRIDEAGLYAFRAFEPLVLV